MAGHCEALLCSHGVMGRGRGRPETSAPSPQHRVASARSPCGTSPWPQDRKEQGLCTKSTSDQQHHAGLDGVPVQDPHPVCCQA